MDASCFIPSFLIAFCESLTLNLSLARDASFPKNRRRSCFTSWSLCSASTTMRSFARNTCSTCFSIAIRPSILIVLTSKSFLIVIYCSEPSWLNRAMEISRLVPNSVTLTSISCHTLSRTAIAHFGDLFQFWEENSSEIFTNILASLQLAIGDSPESVPPVTIPVSLLQYTSSLFNVRRGATC